MNKYDLRVTAKTLVIYFSALGFASYVEDFSFKNLLIMAAGLWAILYDITNTDFRRK